MKKTLLTLAVAALTFTVSDAMAQDKTAATKTEQSAENKEHEANTLEKRIREQIKKVEANKDKVDYKAEMETINGWIKKWEALTEKEWEEKGAEYKY